MFIELMWNVLIRVVQKWFKNVLVLLSKYNLKKNGLMRYEPVLQEVKYLKFKQTYISTNNITNFAVAVNIWTQIEKTSLATNK